MESSGLVAHAMTTVQLPVASNALDPFARDVAAYTNPPSPPQVSHSPAIISRNMNQDSNQTDYLASPAQHIFHDHLRPSNLRGAESSDGNPQDVLDLLPPSPMPAQSQAIDPDRVDMVGRFMKNSQVDTDPISAVSEMSVNPEEMKGYAQLVFPDGEYLVTSTEIMLGRDERAQQILKDQERRRRRESREQALLQARQQAAELDAQKALEEYKLERRTSLEDEDVLENASSASQLEGRPAPGLPSTFSEAGGIVNYEESVNNVRRKQKRRSMLLSRSSSTNSVAPASLHVYGAATMPWSKGDEENKCIFLPIHPFRADDIKKISKEHLRIFYDAVEKHWRMEIKGNGAFVLNELYSDKAVDHKDGDEDTAPRHFKRGDTVILTHNTEVLITSLHFIFKLPQRRGLSTFDDVSSAEDEPASSSKQQDFFVDDEESELSDVEEIVDDTEAQTPSRLKILLKPGKTKKAQSPEPEIPRLTGGKGKKKPKDAEVFAEPQPEPNATEDVMATEASQQPPVFDANSTLQHVPVNELPEKRKGPGRPPKNGLVSKRDEGIIRRKIKEYEKRNERPPPYKEILAIVRAENRAKEIAAKAAARGEPMTNQQMEMMSAVPTTEMEGADLADASATRQSVEPSDNPATIKKADSQEPDEVGDKITQHQQQRSYKSPSPMKPKEEYTEEELKRPTQTYYYILDEILTDGPEDAMELQQIYDKICKKYPFYKYVVESTGWQSSVRHNLKQNERFKPVSKQGKGWLWAIDPAVPLDKEKKKKPTPPPMARPPMPYQQNGMPQPGMQYNAGYGPYNQQMPPGQYTMPQQANTTQQYGPPYAQPGQPQQYQQQQNGQPVPQQARPPQLPQPARPNSHTPSRPTSNTPQPAANAPAALPPAFQDLVEEIMRFRVEYLTPFQKDPQKYASHERIFKRCVEWISQLHMKQNPEVKFENDEEKRVFQILEQMRHRFENGGIQPQNNARPPQPPVNSATPPQPQYPQPSQHIQPQQAVQAQHPSLQGQQQAAQQQIAQQQTAQQQTAQQQTTQQQTVHQQPAQQQHYQPSLAHGNGDLNAAAPGIAPANNTMLPPQPMQNPPNNNAQLPTTAQPPATVASVPVTLPASAALAPAAVSASSSAMSEPDANKSADTAGLPSAQIDVEASTVAKRSAGEAAMEERQDEKRIKS